MTAYLEITEGRIGTADHRYSWCGDFTTWVLMMAGCVDGSALNRAALNNGKWQMGANIARLVDWARKHDALRLPGQGYSPSLLDPVIIPWPNGDHIGLYNSPVNAVSFQTMDGNLDQGIAGYRLRRFDGVKAYICASALPIGYTEPVSQPTGSVSIGAIPVGLTEALLSGAMIDYPIVDQSTVAAGGNGTPVPFKW